MTFRVRSLLLFVLFIVSVTSLLPSLAQDGDEPYDPVIDPDNFVEGVDNRFFPLTPGTIYIYEGESDGTTEHIEVAVLYETREVLDINCVVVRDTVWEDGELVEDTFDWFAQDVNGNVWYMGEESTEYEDGKVVSTEGSWEAGVDGAKPGIIMWADLQIGEPYRQEYYEGEAEDMAQIVDLTATATIEFGEFEEVLVILEWNPLEPGVSENKYFVEDIGLILEEVVEGGEARIELIDIITDLTEADLEERLDDIGDNDDDSDEDDEDEDEGEQDDEDEGEDDND